MTAIQESFADNSFTSATVITRESFNLTRSNLTFEVRAAFPIQDKIFGQIVLVSDVTNQTNNGEIVLAVNFGSSIATVFDHPSKKLKPYVFETNPIVTEFSHLRLDFNQGLYRPRLIWSQNENAHLERSQSVNLPCNDLCRKILNAGTFKLAIDLLMLSPTFEPQLIIDESKDWLCTSMIIDHVWVYELGQTEFPKRKLNSNTRASDICKVVINELCRKGPKFQLDIKTIIMITMAIVLLIALIIIVLVVKKKRKTKHGQDEEIYSDCFDEKHRNGNEYCDSPEADQVYDQINNYDQVEIIENGYLAIF